MNETEDQSQSEILTDAYNQLCMECGMCCNGTLFSSVRVVHSDRSSDLPDGFSIGKLTGHFDQPCPALTSAGCSIYKHRPRVCKEFDCKLLQKLRNRETTIIQAQQKVKETLALRNLVVKELQYLFESTDKFHSLSIRFSELQASLNNKIAFEKACGTLDQHVEHLTEQLETHFTARCVS